MRKQLLATCLLVGTASGAQAGIMSSEVTLAQHAPPCVETMGGGIANQAEGLEINLTNHCPTPIHITQLLFGTSPDDLSAPATGIDGYISRSGAPNYRRALISPTGPACSYDSIPEQPMPIAAVPCGSTITLQPHENLTLFGKPYFRITGEGGLLIEGRADMRAAQGSRDVPEADGAAMVPGAALSPSE